MSIDASANSPIARTLAREDDGVARRVRAQVDEPGKCRGSGSGVACVRPSRRPEHIALFYRTVG